MYGFWLQLVYAAAAAAMLFLSHIFWVEYGHFEWILLFGHSFLKLITKFNQPSALKRENSYSAHSISSCNDVTKENTLYCFDDVIKWKVHGPNDVTY